MKFFNTAGPVNQPNHYKIDPLQRWDFEEVLMLIEQQKYFILHAPRQTGKTSSLLALEEYLNDEGSYRAVYVNIEGAQAARNDVKEGILSVMGSIANGIDDNDLKWRELADLHSPLEALSAYLGYLARTFKKPFVLLVDEIDALIGDTLISVLRQIRAGYPKRPAAFPVSIILCGVRDIHDYRIHKSNDDVITGGSAFNIKAESLRLGNFSKEDIVNLYGKHTEETGQKFEDDCFELIWEYTEGQPWLVNALAYEVTFKMKANRDRKVVITAEMIEDAKNRIILARATHLGQLADKLKEDRVRRVILPIIMNESAKTHEDDKEYCIDLGLIKRTSRGIVIANAIYREIIPRELSKEHQDNFQTRFQPEWINKDDTINTDKLISMFQQFWRENSDIWASHIKGYQEAAPHLVFQAFLQRVANGRGFIGREYALGRGRTDLMLKWKSAKAEQRIVFELKVMTKKNNYESVKEKALEQTADYAHKCLATDSHILVFDRDEKTDWRQKVFTDHGECDGVKMTIWGM